VRERMGMNAACRQDALIANHITFGDPRPCAQLRPRGPPEDPQRTPRGPPEDPQRTQG